MSWMVSFKLILPLIRANSFKRVKKSGISLHLFPEGHGLFPATTGLNAV